MTVYVILLVRIVYAFYLKFFKVEKKPVTDLSFVDRPETNSYFIGFEIFL
jgi:hypothetical protein